MFIELPDGLFFNENGTSFLNSNLSYLSPCGKHELMNTSLSSNVTENNLSSDVTDNIIGYVLVSLDAVTSVIVTYIATYKINEVGVTTIVFWLAFIGVTLPAFLMAATETPTFPSLLPCIVFMACHMLLSGSHSFFFLYGYRTVPPVFVGLICMAEVPVNFILQYTVLSGLYPGHATIVEVLGACLVIIGVGLLPVCESKRFSPKSKDIK
jgi:drug/metabolite transporter (DMT)-like permease